MMIKRIVLSFVGVLVAGTVQGAEYPDTMTAHAFPDALATACPN